MDYCDFDTFPEKEGTKTGTIPSQYPDNITFNNLLEEGHNYFQIYIPCELENAHEYVMPKKKFYITNDSEDGLFYKVSPTGPMTRLEVASEILNWLMIRNVYYNVDIQKRAGMDIPAMGIGDYASNLSVFGITKSDEERDGFPVYTIDISS